jgi:hypothetical protein
LKRLRRLEGVVEELSGQVEIEAIKHSPSSDQSSTHRDGESTESKGTGVRIVGMDEGTSRKTWMERNWNMGCGPAKSIFRQKSEGETASLVLDEGKSKYMSNPFWASINEVSPDPVVSRFVTHSFHESAQF